MRHPQGISRLDCIVPLEIRLRLFHAKNRRLTRICEPSELLPPRFPCSFTLQQAPTVKKLSPVPKNKVRVLPLGVSTAYRRICDT
jgi:hypothetical protein